MSDEISADSAGRRARILILEDEAWDAELAQRSLASAGLSFTAVVVETETSFTEQLAAFRPDVILSDYHLPGFSGQKALRITQEHSLRYLSSSGPVCSETKQQSSSSSREPPITS
jgi:CheY-like chemotaxis protein